MTNKAYRVSLGFTKQTFPAGVHICQIFSDNEERLDSLLGFLRSGLAAGEKTACFTDNLDEAYLSSHLADHSLCCAEFKASGALTKAGAREIYFQDGCFDPDRMLSMLEKYHEDSVAKGYPAARVIGEMSFEVENIEGGSRLMEYESRVSMLLRTHPVTAVCQYDANAFDGATIMKVLKVHPLMVIRGAVVHNPYYVPPEEVLAL